MVDRRLPKAKYSFHLQVAPAKSGERRLDHKTRFYRDASTELAPSGNKMDHLTLPPPDGRGSEKFLRASGGDPG